MDKRQIIDSHTLSKGQVEEFTVLMSSITKSAIKLSHISEHDEHKKFLEEVAGITNIPRPVLQYIFFGEVTGYY